MNLLAMADTPLVVRVIAFAVVFAGTAALTMFTIGKSKRLSDFLDVLSEESLPWRTRLGALAQLWRGSGPPRLTDRLQGAQPSRGGRRMAA